MEEKDGITLVALAITIIILIILAAVTINSVLKFNIVNRAVEGAEKYAEAQEGEKKQFDELADKLEEYIGRIEKKAVILTIVKQEETKVSVVSTGIKEGDEIQSYTFQISETGKEEDFDEGTKIETKETKCEYTYGGIEKGKTYYLRVVVTYESGEKKYSNVVKIEGTSGEQGGTGEDVYIGKYVNYVPKGKDYTVTSALSGHTSDQTFTFGIGQTSVKWQMWSMNDEKLTLIASTPVENITLYEANGYNNGVWILDNICSSLYGNSDYNGLTARNIKMSDIEKVTEYDFMRQYEESKSYVAAKSYYPNIWNEVDKNDNTAPFATRHQQNKTYSGYAGGNVGMTFRNKYWDYQYSSEKKEEEWIDPIYYDLIYTRNSYLFSSRTILATDNYCWFGMNYFYDSLQNKPLFRSDLDLSLCVSRREKIRPMIEIPASSYTLTNSNTEGIDFDIQPK